MDGKRLIGSIKEYKLEVKSKENVPQKAQSIKLEFKTVMELFENLPPIGKSSISDACILGRAHSHGDNASAVCDSRKNSKLVSQPLLIMVPYFFHT